MKISRVGSANTDKYTYLPPSPVSEIPRIRYRCKALCRGPGAAPDSVQVAVLSQEGQAIDSEIVLRLGKGTPN